MPLDYDAIAYHTVVGGAADDPARLLERYVIRKEHRWPFVCFGDDRLERIVLDDFAIEQLDMAHLRRIDMGGIARGLRRDDRS